MDFDFFAFEEIDPLKLKQRIPYLKDAPVIQSEPNTLTCLVDRGGPVKLSFFGLPHLRPFEPPLLTEDTNLPVARLLSLSGHKALVVQARASAKDYIDIEALIRLGGIPLADQLDAATKIYGADFEIMPTLKALTYFEGGDLDTVPDETRKALRKAVEAYSKQALKLQPHRGRTRKREPSR